MANFTQNTNAYSQNSGIPVIFPGPIPFGRDPVSGSDGANFGRIAINTTTDTVFIYNSVTKNWISIGGGSATFTNIVATGSITAGTTMAAGTTVTGATGVIATTGNVTASAGNVVATLGNVTANGASGRVSGTFIDTNNAVNHLTLTDNNIDALGSATDIDINLIPKGTGKVNMQAPIEFGSTGPQIRSGSGDPNGNALFTSPQGSLYLNVAGSGINDRLWVNTTGSTVWTSVVTVA